MPLVDLSLVVSLEDACSPMVRFVLLTLDRYAVSGGLVDLSFVVSLEDACSPMVSHCYCVS